MYWIITALCALGLMYLLGGYILFYKACARGRELDWEDPVAVSKTQYAPYVEVLPMARQWLKEHGAESVFMQNREGLRLHGCLVPRENAKGTVILFHGYRSNYLVEFNAILETYHRLGFRLLLVDQRCHRLSEGAWITFGVKESRDALDWLSWHNERFGLCPVFMSGLSMGSSTVQYAAGTELPENVRGITADCGFTSPYEILLHVAGKQIGIFAKLLMPAADFWAKLLAGFRLKECDTRTSLARCRVPILMIHGEADDFVPCRMSRESFAACSSEKELHTVAGAGHGVSYLHDRQRLEQALKAFFLRNLPKEEHP